MSGHWTHTSEWDGEKGAAAPSPEEQKEGDEVKCAPEGWNGDGGAARAQ